MERTAVPNWAKGQEAAATEPQLSYIKDLIEQRAIPEDKLEDTKRQLEAGLTKKQASAWIERLRTLPRKTSTFGRVNEKMPQIEPGYFAVRFAKNGPLKFFRVRHGKEDSRWAGFLFIDAGRGGPHEGLAWTAVKDVDYKQQIAKAINKNPQKAAQTYGQEIGRCGICGRTLTDEISRAFGIGPVCRAEKGW